MAETAGLSLLLARDFGTVLREPVLTVDAAAALRRMRHDGRNTLRELLTPPEHRILAPVREELRARIAAALVRLAPRAIFAPPWDSADALVAWAAERGLEGLLRTDVTAIDGLIRDRGQVRRIELLVRPDTAVRDVACARPRTRDRFVRAIGPDGWDELLDATRDHVLKQADRAFAIAAELAAENAAWDTRSSDPVFLRLAELRRRQPERRRRLAASSTDHLAIAWTDAPAGLALRFRCPVTDPWERPTNVSVSLPADPERAARCSCYDPRCSHVHLALDLVRGILASTPDHPALAAMREHLVTPPWARLLGVLDRAVARAAPGEDPVERIAWRVGSVRDPDEEPTLTPVRQKRRAGGGWTAGTRVDPRGGAADPACTDADRRALEELRRGDAGRWDRGLRGEAALRALLALREHPAVFLDEPETPPLRIRETRLALTARPRREGVYRLAAAIDGAEVPLDLLIERLDENGVRHVHRFVEEPATVAIAPIPPSVAAILKAIAEADAAFPPEALAELAARAGKLEGVLPLELPDSALGEEVPASDEVVLRLAPADDLAIGVNVLARPLACAPAVTPGEGALRVVGSADGRRLFARRRFDREVERANAVLASLPLPPEAFGEETSRFTFLVSGEAALDLVAHLATRPPEPGLAVEWTRPPRRVTRVASGRDLRIQVVRQRDWFGVDGKVEVDGAEVELVVALDAARRGARYVEAGPDLFVALGAELKDKLARAADALHAGRHGLEAGLPAAAALDDLFEEAGELELAAEFRALLDRIRTARVHEPPPPASFATVLRPYQLDGFRWMARLAAWGAGGCLADDMGLGKTLQALALLAHRREAGPALVIAPTSVCGNWLREAERFAAPLRLVSYAGLDGRAQAVEALGPGDVLVASYGLVARDAARIAGKRFATLILDEAQAVKNADTARAKAIRALDAEVRFALTGTPLENHLGELWSLFRIVVPGLLGSFDSFRGKFGLPIEREKNESRRDALKELLRPFLLRRRKDEVARELPPRTEAEVTIELSAGEKRLYEEARLAAAARLQGLVDETSPEHRRFELLAGITRLRLCACHPKLYDPASKLPSSKLARLVELLGELKDEGHKALVFSQFTSHLDLVEPALEHAGITSLRLDGSTPAARRQQLVDAFQAGAADVFLISLKAGGTGLNLTAADYVLHLDPWWNPAVEDQATDRAHRIGQDRPVTVLRLVSKGTIEEAILSLHAGKRALVEGILEGADAAARVSAEELLALIAPRTA